MTEALLAANIFGHQQSQVALSTSEASSEDLEDGYYDVWCDVETWVKVGVNASGVTSSTGYVLFPGNVVTFEIDQGQRINAIAGGAGTLSIHRIG